MTTLATELTADLCRATPSVQVLDNRGLVVRSLQFNRTQVTDLAAVRISQQCHDARGQLNCSLDPRLGAARQLDPAVMPNFRYQSSLSGRSLRRQSVDAGEQVTLYDLEGSPVWQRNSRQQTRRWVYDAQHRVSEVYEQATAAAERISERWLYAEPSFDPAANARGQLLGHYDTAGLHAVLAYALGGQVLHSTRQLLADAQAESDWQGVEADWQAQLQATTYRTRQAYNALGRVISTLDAKGNRQQQRYNLAGQLAGSGLTLAATSPEQPLLCVIHYSAAGQVLREEAGNGVLSEYHYEPQTQRLSWLLSTRPSTSGGRTVLLQDLSYSYDLIGNLLAISDAAQAVRHHKNQRIVAANAYQYDALYQLTQASGRENAGNGVQGADLPDHVPINADPSRFSHYTRAYTYDSGGNLTQIRHQGASAYTTEMLVSPTSNRAIQQTGGLLPADVEGHFDAAGNLRQLAPGQTLYWDARNQLQQVVQVTRRSGDDAETYQYDGAGQRLRKTSVSHTSGTVRTAEVIYLPGLELRVTHSDSGGGPTLVEELHVLRASAGRQSLRLLHWEAGGPADITNDQLRASLDNQIGSSLLELDQHADLLTQEEYFPYGGTAVWSGKSISETKYKFVRYSGKERDATGLYYYGFRYYAPWLGRWLNPDPAGTIDGLNLYWMVRNNPTSWTDIEGCGARATIVSSFGSIKAAQKSAEEVYWALNASKSDYAFRGGLNLLTAATAVPISTAMAIANIPIAGTVINKILRRSERNLNPRLLKAKNLSPEIDSKEWQEQIEDTFTDLGAFSIKNAQRAIWPVARAIKGAENIVTDGLPIKASGVGHLMKTVDRTWEAAEGYSTKTLRGMLEEIPKLKAKVAEIERIGLEAFAGAQSKSIKSAHLLKWEAWQYDDNLLEKNMLFRYAKSIVGADGGMITPEALRYAAAKANTQLDSLETNLMSKLYPANSWGSQQAQISPNSMAPIAYFSSDWGRQDIEVKLAYRKK